MLYDNEDIEFSSDDEDYIPSITFSAKKSDSTRMKSQKTFKPKNQQPEKYTDLKIKIRECFSNAIVMPVMNLNDLYAEKYICMFNFKNGGCLKGKYHGHKTITAYLKCCQDSFQLIDSKTVFVRRTDKRAIELVQKRLTQHHKEVFDRSSDYMMHLEMLIINLFPSKTTIFLEDLERLFQNIYNISINTFCKKHDLTKTLQLINSPNLQVSITRKSTKLICIPIHCKEFHHYKKHEKEYSRVIEIEEQLCKPQFQNFNKNINNNEDKIEQRVNSRSIKIFKNDKLKDLLFLSDMNVPKSIQSTEQKFPTPSELFKEVEKGLEIEPVWLYIVQSLKLDNEENSFFNLNK